MNDVDVAVIGGGISGVYSAWRIKSQTAYSVALFERDKRIGGRLLSIEAPGAPNMIAELGAMRILPAVQPKIRNLITVLNDTRVNGDIEIELYDFPVDQPENIAFLRGKHLRVLDFTRHPEQVPYHLNFLEYGNTPGKILVEAIEQIVPGITASGLNDYSRRAMARKAGFDDKPLHEQGFWNVLMRVISGEAYLLGVDAGGYQSTLMNWNAANAIPWFLADFGIDPHYQGFKCGFQEVPNTIAKRFQRQSGRLELGMEAKSITIDEGRFVISFVDETVRAKRVILAMPRRALELLAEHSPILCSPQVLANIRSVTPRPLFKLFTTYANPWWRAAGCPIDGRFRDLSVGRSVTDLPIRQTYYWTNREGQPMTKGRAMLMASYDDGSNIGYWDGFPRGKDLFKGEASAKQHPEWCDHAPPARLVDEVARQLGILHGLSYTPRVIDAAYMDWSQDPFGGGWNAWNIGVKSEEVSRNMVQPLGKDVPLYVCGEAYSESQGWVEGALLSADLMLHEWGIDSLS